MYLRASQTCLLPNTAHTYTSKNKHHAEFKKADYDKNGTLSREEVAGFIQGLRLGLGPKEVERFCRLADFNGDGVVVCDSWRRD